MLHGVWYTVKPQETVVTAGVMMTTIDDVSVASTTAVLRKREDIVWDGTIRKGFVEVFNEGNISKYKWIPIRCDGAGRRKRESTEPGTSKNAEEK